MLLASFYINWKNISELVLTGDNSKNTKTTVIQKKCKKYSIFVINADVNKIAMEI